MGKLENSVVGKSKSKGSFKQKNHVRWNLSGKEGDKSVYSFLFFLAEHKINFELYGELFKEDLGWNVGFCDTPKYFNQRFSYARVEFKSVLGKEDLNWGVLDNCELIEDTKFNLDDEGREYVSNLYGVY